MTSRRQPGVPASTSPDILAAEAWFRRRGLPWFVDSVDARVRALLRRRWLWMLLIGVAVVAAAAAGVSHLLTDNWPSAVLLFLAVGVAFLVTRLPEQVREVREAAAGDGVVKACRGTPLEQRAREVAQAPLQPGAAGGQDEPLSGTQRANLL
ncbi:hypothetical protein [Micromonospora sp. ATCC 39149]|uniref:Uncharacterized protein n=1 Tax=Micromonospora carbonacea TaxID=47853 RepID=A0A7D6GB94_9ACTN|nr:hypothetical protein [Micromonospora sp. ATCC 39149]QLK01024.1 hypothetical protein HZU44_14160 [Micromonospora carbonacea]